MDRYLPYYHAMPTQTLCHISLALCILASLAACGFNTVSSGTQIGLPGEGSTTPVEPPTDATPIAVPTPAPVQQGWSGIIGQGQSLSVGFYAALPATSAAATGGMRLCDDGNTYDITDPGNPNLRLVPLTEPFRTPPANVQTAAYPYPSNIAGKTPHSAMAEQISSLASRAGYASFTTVHTAAGIGGQPMSAINRGGSQNSYAASIYEAKALTALALAQNQTLHYDAIIFTHGEADSSASNTHYGQDLADLHAAYSQDLPAITGQADANIVLILSQQQSYPPGNYPLSAVIAAQWQASVDNPGKIICAGPKYQYGYVADAVHMPITGYDRLGEKYGQAYWQTVVEHTPFVPLSPSQINRTAANIIIVSLHVPVPPLNWDLLLPYSHQSANTAWANGRGFEVLDPNGAAVTIQSVSLDANANTVELQLSGAPSTTLTLSYAMTADVTAFQGGLAGGRMGHLRDSDPFVGASAEALDCQTTAGSPNIVCSQGLDRRALYDVVTPGDSAIVGLSLSDHTTATLSAPWAGATGTNTLSFHHEHRNYLVSFSLPVSAP